MARCRLCGAPAIARIEYARAWFCEKHFLEFIDRKVRRALERYSMLGHGRRIVVAVSGGKDSAVLLYVLAKLGKELGIELHALHIDLGIEGYSEKMVEAVRRLCNELGVPLTIYSLPRELGFSVVDLARKLRRNLCSVCGMVKRFVLNAAGVEMRAVIATGHNADDIASYAIKSLIVQDYASLSKLVPVNEGIEGIAAPRIKPLYDVYEDEARLYAELAKVIYDPSECPYVDREAIEFLAKEFLERVERRSPGIKMSFLRKLAVEAPKLRTVVGGEEVGRCDACGLISMGSRCAFCRATEKAFGKALGREVRSFFATLAPTA